MTEAERKSATYTKSFANNGGVEIAVGTPEEREEEDRFEGRTVIESLSSMEVERNLMTLATVETRPDEIIYHSFTGCRPPSILIGKTLSEIATVQSKTLSFTPTMAENMFETGVEQHRPSPGTSGEGSPIALAQQDAALIGHHLVKLENRCLAQTVQLDESTIETDDIHAEKGVCPFCSHDQEKQRGFYMEREHSLHLKLFLTEQQAFQSKAWMAISVILMGLVAAIGSFFLGKFMSDIQAEKAMAQYMDQCSAMMTQKSERELYMKLVTSATGALVQAMAGPLASFIFNAGGPSRQAK